MSYSQESLAATDAEAYCQRDELRVVLQDATLDIASRLGAYDSNGLLAHASTLQHSERLAHGTLSERLRVAVPLALACSLRLLNLSCDGPERVWQLPLAQVLRAANLSFDLCVFGVSGRDYPPERASDRRDPLASGGTFGMRSIHDWLERNELRRWLVDQTRWQQAETKARDASAYISGEQAVERLRTKQIVWVCLGTLDGGPLDGARCLEAVFDNGEMLSIPAVVGSAHELLVGTRLRTTVEADSNERVLVFVADDERQVLLQLDSASYIKHQRSPVEASAAMVSSSA